MKRSLPCFGSSSGEIDLTPRGTLKWNRLSYVLGRFLEIIACRVVYMVNYVYLQLGIGISEIIMIYYDGIALK